MRGNWILLELLVMVLVFALAAGACLGVFVQARLMAQETARLDGAVALAQNAAELLKAGKDPQILDTGELEMEISRNSGEIPGLLQAEIVIFYEKTPVFSLTAGWQEVRP